MTARLTKEDFAPHLGVDFPLQADGGPHPLRLVKVTPGAAAPDDAGWQPFSLLFEGPPEPMLPQATYRLDHPVSGWTDVFLVPVGQDASGTRYEAVFG